MSPLSLILNILWLLTGGIWMAAGWLLAAVIMAITIIGLPWARAAFNIADILSKKQNVRMILLGGVYHAASASFSSDDSLAALSRFGINKAFISAGGVDVERGASCSNFHEVPIKQKAMQGAIESHLVVDSSKFGKIRPAYFARIDQFDSIITEAGTQPRPSRKVRI